MFFRKLFVVGAAILALGVAAGAAFAQTDQQKAMIDAAKAQGTVGEQADGYIGIREPGAVSSELRAAITVTNNARREAYARSAAEAGDGPPPRRPGPACSSACCSPASAAASGTATARASGSSVRGGWRSRRIMRNLEARHS